MGNEDLNRLKRSLSTGDFHTKRESDIDRQRQQLYNYQKESLYNIKSKNKSETDLSPISKVEKLRLAYGMTSDSYSALLVLNTQDAQWGAGSSQLEKVKEVLEPTDKERHDKANQQLHEAIKTISSNFSRLHENKITIGQYWKIVQHALDSYKKVQERETPVNIEQFAKAVENLSGIADRLRRITDQPRATDKVKQLRDFYQSTQAFLEKHSIQIQLESKSLANKTEASTSSWQQELSLEQDELLKQLRDKYSKELHDEVRRKLNLLDQRRETLKQWESTNKELGDIRDEEAKLYNQQDNLHSDVFKVKQDMLTKKKDISEAKLDILTRREMLLRDEQIDEENRNKQRDGLNKRFDLLLMAEEHLKAQQDFYTWEQDLSPKIKYYEALQAYNADSQETLDSLKKMQDSLSKYRSYSQRCNKVINLELRIHEELESVLPPEQRNKLEQEQRDKLEKQFGPLEQQLHTLEKYKDFLIALESNISSQEKPKRLEQIELIIQRLDIMEKLQDSVMQLQYAKKKLTNPKLSDVQFQSTDIQERLRKPNLLSEELNDLEKCSDTIAKLADTQKQLTDSELSPAQCHNLEMRIKIISGIIAEQIDFYKYKQEANTELSRTQHHNLEKWKNAIKELKDIEKQLEDRDLSRAKRYNLERRSDIAAKRIAIHKRLPNLFERLQPLDLSERLQENTIKQIVNLYEQFQTLDALTRTYEGLHDSRSNRLLHTSNGHRLQETYERLAESGRVKGQVVLSLHIESLKKWQDNLEQEQVLFKKLEELDLPQKQNKQLCEVNIQKQLDNLMQERRILKGLNSPDLDPSFFSGFHDSKRRKLYRSGWDQGEILWGLNISDYDDFNEGSYNPSEFICIPNYQDQLDKLQQERKEQEWIKVPNNLKKLIELEGRLRKLNNKKEALKRELENLENPNATST